MAFSRYYYNKQVKIKNDMLKMDDLSNITRRRFLASSAKFFAAATAIDSAAVLAALAITKAPPPGTITGIIPANGFNIKEAMYWERSCAGVQCTLCPFRCFLPEGQRGRCNVRVNSGGKLVTLVYAMPVSVHVDPIEKKPVFHMLPGSGIYSLATVGCSLRCLFCQNWDISQAKPETIKGTHLPPEQVVENAVASKCISIAYTYSEPIVFYEYVYDIAKLAKKNGLYNVMVSCGYINAEPLRELAPYFDVIKIDLKGFNERFYKEVVGGPLSPVLNTLTELKKMNVLTEVVNLVVPGMNDDLGEIKRMATWIHGNLGENTPLFFSRFTPHYRLNNLPPTPIETLEKARDVALKTGLKYVYLGNVPGHPAENTYCPGCGQILVGRYGYAVTSYNIAKNRCRFCGEQIPGLWWNM